MNTEATQAAPSQNNNDKDGQRRAPQMGQPQSFLEACGWHDDPTKRQEYVRPSSVLKAVRMFSVSKSVHEDITERIKKIPSVLSTLSVGVVELSDLNCSVSELSHDGVSVVFVPAYEQMPGDELVTAMFVLQMNKKKRIERVNRVIYSTLVRTSIYTDPALRTQAKRSASPIHPDVKGKTSSMPAAPKQEKKPQQQPAAQAAPAEKQAPPKAKKMNLDRACQTVREVLRDNPEGVTGDHLVGNQSFRAALAFLLRRLKIGEDALRVEQTHAKRKIGRKDLRKMLDAVQPLVFPSDMDFGNNMDITVRPTYSEVVNSAFKAAAEGSDTRALEAAAALRQQSEQSGEPGFIDPQVKAGDQVLVKDVHPQHEGVHVVGEPVAEILAATGLMPDALEMADKSTEVIAEIAQNTPEILPEPQAVAPVQTSGLDAVTFEQAEAGLLDPAWNQPNQLEGVTNLCVEQPVSDGGVVVNTPPAQALEFKSFEQRVAEESSRLAPVAVIAEDEKFTSVEIGSEAAMAEPQAQA